MFRLWQEKFLPLASTLPIGFLTDFSRLKSVRFSLRIIVAARKNQPMYCLTILDVHLAVLQYSGNPWVNTLPVLVETLSAVLDETQSYGTILAAINTNGVYARGAMDQVGNSCVAIITRMQV